MRNIKNEEVKFLKEIGLFDHLSDGVLKIPDHCTSLKIDIGLAGDAPNSARWLMSDPHVFVIGIEPLEYHHKHLYELGSPEGTEEVFCHPTWPIVQLKHNAVLHNREKVCDISDRFILLKTAINKVDSFGKQKFYVNKVEEGETGSSTLSKAVSDKRPHLLDKVIDVNICSLEYILDLLPLQGFKYIEHIKTDCEGMDFQVIQSIGDKIEKALFVTCEISHVCNPEELLNLPLVRHMLKHRFVPFLATPNSVNFVKREYYHDAMAGKLKLIYAGM